VKFRVATDANVQHDPNDAGANSMQAAIEISLYPLNEHYIEPIKAFIKKLNSHPELTVQTNSMSTQVWGPLERTMSILAQEMELAAGVSKRLIFVLKVIPGLAPP
jgi:uncharacterized protein YqgV (UPF0045/DUF77 family)